MEARDLRNIRTIFRTDLKNICSHFFPLVIAIGLCALPALYAWFNIYANWDPYGSTSNIEIAVVSLDRGYQISDGETMNMGDAICDNLREATSIGWVFLDTENEVVEGVYSGQYYAGIVIDPDFSESMYTALSDNFQNPRITYYENEKKNAVGTKITDTAVDTLRKSINQQFINVVTQRIFETTNDVSEELEEDNVFERFEDDLKDINDKLSDYQTMIGSFMQGNAMLKSTISGATGSMDQTRTKLENENGYMQQATSDMASTRAAMNAFNVNVQNTMNGIEASINQISVDIDQSGIAQDAQSLDAQLQKIVQDADSTIMDATALKNALNKVLVADAEQKATSAPTEAELQAVYDDAYEAAYPIARQHALDEGKSPAEADTIAAAEATAAATAAKEAYKAEREKGLSQNTIDEINDAVKVVEQISTGAAEIKVEALNAIDTTVAEKTATQASASAKKILATCTETVENIKSLYNNTLVPQMDTLLNSMQQILDNVDQLLSSLDTALGDMDTVFDGILATVDNTDQSLEQTEQVIRDVSSRLTEITDRLDQVAEDERAEELVKILSGDPALYGSFFSEPVVVNTNEIYPVKNYGSAVTPFYTTLAIWVGSIFLTALFKVKADPAGLDNPKSWELFLGRYLIFFVLSQIQALIIVIGDIAVFRVQCLHPGMFWFASAVTAFVFSVLIYSLAISFGDIGKALAVVMVVIQIAGSSGTFPIELLPGFYRTVYIFFPFPYAINAMRECIGGLYENTYGTCLWELLIFAGVALFIGLVVRIPLVGVNHFIEERMEDTRLL